VQARKGGVKEGHNSLGAESLRGRRKVQIMSRVLYSMHQLQKDLKFRTWGGAKLASCPGRYVTSMRPAM